MTAKSEPFTGGVLLGSGTKRVLVLHGWLGGAVSWSSLWPLLDGDRFTYAFLNFRGYGDRLAEPGEYTMPEAAKDALAAADRFGWREFSLVGHSMGGLAAQLVMADAPERITRLLGISPVPASGSPLGPREPAFRAAVRDNAARAALFAASTGDRHGRAWCQKMTGISVADTSADALDRYLSSWTDHDASSRIAGITTPVHVVVGEHDPAYPTQRVRNTWGRFYPHCGLRVIADAGHYPMHENPAALVEVMEEFLAHGGGTRAAPAEAALDPDE